MFLSNERAGTQGPGNACSDSGKGFLEQCSVFCSEMVFRKYLGEKGLAQYVPIVPILRALKNFSGRGSILYIFYSL